MLNMTFFSRCGGSLLCAVLFVALSSGPTTVSGYTVLTEFGADFKAFCPKRMFVSQFIVHKGHTNRTEKDLKFFLKCSRFFEGKDKAAEFCRLKFRFVMPNQTLMLDNHWKSCTCDEYLAGVKSYFRRHKDGRHQRIVQLRCCFAMNKFMNITSCYYTGLRYLLSPWETVLKVRSHKEPREAIQSFFITENYINARVCTWEFGKNKHFINKCDGTKKRSIKDVYNKLKGWAEGNCEIPMSAPFGWPESSNSFVTPARAKEASGIQSALLTLKLDATPLNYVPFNLTDSDIAEKAISHKSSRLYERQQHMCQDGNYMYAVYKYARNGTKGKDYIFLTRCHELTYSVCKCSWKMNCTKPEKRNTSKSNETWYVAGWRSEWNKERARREVEVLCCKSKGLEMLYCNTTKNYTDGDLSLTIARPRYDWDAFKDAKVQDGEIIRDIDQWHINGDGECNEKCYDCEDIDPTGGICTTTTSTTSTTSTSASTTTVDTGEYVEEEVDCVAPTCSQYWGGTTCLASTCQTQCNTWKPGGTQTTVACRVNPARVGALRCFCEYTGDCSCTPRWDFTYLLDESGSLGADNFLREKNFLTSFTNLFTIGPQDSRVSLIRFATGFKVEFDFASYTPQTQTGVTDRISAVNYQAGSTNITAAITSATTIFANNYRGVNQVALLVTDGRHNQGDPQPPAAAQILRDAGVVIFAIGVGNGIVEQDLIDITGDVNRVFLTDFNTLESTAGQIETMVRNSV